MKDYEVTDLPIEMIYLPSRALRPEGWDMRAHGQWLSAYWEALREKRRFTYLFFSPCDTGPRQGVLPLIYH